MTATTTKGETTMQQRPMEQSACVVIALLLTATLSGAARADVLKMVDQGGTAILLACPDLLPGNPHLTERLTSPSIVEFLQKFGLGLADKTQGGHGDSFFIRKTGDLFGKIGTSGLQIV